MGRTSTARYWRALMPHLLTLIISVCLYPSLAFAQGGTASATLAGRVVDDSGGVLPGVTVTLVNLATNQTRSIITNAEGLYHFAGLTPSRYSVTADLSGFATFNQPDLAVNVGSSHDLNITLRISDVQETVTVTGDSALVQPATTDLSTVITQQQIETLPSNNRNYLDFALLTPATVENFSTTSQGVGLNIGGARAKEGSVLVDGFWNTDESFTFPRLKYSQDAIQEFQVVSLGATAEFGRAIGGIINAVTKSGGNQHSGSAYGFLRDERLNAQAVLEKERGAPKSEFDRQVYGMSTGGPIRRDRLFFFGAAERTQQDTPSDNNITASNAAALGLPREDVGNMTLYVRDIFAMGKATHVLNDANSFQYTYAMTRDASTPVFSAFATRSRQLRLYSLDQSAQMQWTRVAREGRWLHDLRLDFHHRNYMLDNPDVGGPPLSPEGQLRASNAANVNITRVANFGGGRISNEMFTRSGQIIYSSTISKNTHAIRVGVDGLFVDFDYLNYSGSGTYAFGSLADYQSGRWTTYTQSFGDPLLPAFHTFVSGYAQDSWTVNDRLTLNYGLRYDLEFLSKHRGQSFGEDHNNFGPRVAMSLDVTGSGRTFAKVSGGLYYDRIFQNPIQPTFFGLKDDPQRLTATWLFGQPGAPEYPSTLPAETLPPNAPLGVRNVWIVPDDFAVPASAQFVGTLEHAFSNDFAGSVSLLYNRSWNKEMPFDRNLEFDEARHAWVRPDPAFRSISQYSFSARAEYTGVVVEATRRVSDRFTLNGNLTYARAYDMGNNFSTSPQDMRFPEDEWGPQADTPKFRGVINGAYSFSDALQAAVVYRGRTGSAFDPRAGATFDLNGDGQFNDRTPGFERNAFRGPGTQTVDARLTWSLSLQGSRRLQVMLEGFNLLNAKNVSSVYSTYGPNPSSPDPLFLSPIQYFPPREVQLGVRFVF